MASVMDFLKGAAPVEVQKGKGKGKGVAAADASDNQVLRQIVPILVNLDRECSALRDRSGFVAIITNEDFKGMVAQARAQWKDCEEKRNEKWQAENGPDVKEPSVKRHAAGAPAADAGASQASQAARGKAAGGRGTAPLPPEGKKPPHPMGGALRGVLLKLMFELLYSKTPAQAGHAAALNTLRNMAADVLDKNIHRSKPNHQTHKEGYAWVWSFMTSETCTEEFRNLLHDIMIARTEGLRFASQHSQDGPIVKWLLQWQQVQYQRG